MKRWEKFVLKECKIQEAKFYLKMFQQECKVQDCVSTFSTVEPLTKDHPAERPPFVSVDLVQWNKGHLLCQYIQYSGTKTTHCVSIFSTVEPLTKDHLAERPPFVSVHSVQWNKYHPLCQYIRYSRTPQQRPPF